MQTGLTYISSMFLYSSCNEHVYVTIREIHKHILRVCSVYSMKVRGC